MDIIKAYRLVFLGVFFAALITIFFASCEGPETTYTPTIKTFSFDLDSIKQRGSLIALVDNSTTSYFTYKGQPMGFEYELLKRFCESQNIQLDVRVVYSLDEVLELLKAGKGDIVAANITVTKERAKQVAFSDPILKTKQVLVQLKNRKEKIENASELGGKTVHVRKETSFYQRLKNLEEEIGDSINIVAVSDTGENQTVNKTLQFIRQVSEGEIDFTVADENIAKVEKKMYPNIDIKTPISFPQNIAWACRKSDTSLVSAINKWLSHEKKRNDFYTIYTKYFRARTKLKKKVNSEYSSMSGGISPFDPIIKELSKDIEWDWRLLASQIYQESKFDPNAESWTGASGLMQLLPKTAQAYDVDSTLIFDPKENITAGVNYLKWLDQCWQLTVKDTIERTKFVLASFNVGLGHIIDARNLASKYGKSPQLWDDNVAEFVLLKSEKKYYQDEVCKHGYCRGREPYNYVLEVMNRYDHYTNLLPEK
ncbi:MAG: transporter substrate-binding domain-containing protein [Salibacteraceae bacterium]